MAQVHGEVHGHLRHVARAERRVRGHDARHARLRLEFLRELHRLRPEADGELESDGLRVAGLDHLDKAVRVVHGGPSTSSAGEKPAPPGESFGGDGPDYPPGCALAFAFTVSTSMRH